MKTAFIISISAFFILSAYYFFDSARTNRYNREGHVFLPNRIGLIGLVCALLFHIPLAIIAFTGGSLAASVIFCFFAWLSASLVVARINKRIEYSEDEFTYTNFFGVKKRYSYSNLTGQYQNHGKTTLYAKSRPLRIDGLAVGEAEFISFAKKRWRTVNGGKSLPVIEKYRSEKALFRKNVKNPGEFIFIYCLVLLMMLAVIIMMLAVGMRSEKKEDLIYADVTIQSLEITDDEIRIAVDETNLPFVLCGKKKLLTDNPELIDRLSQSGETFRFGYNEYGSGVKKYGFVATVTADGGAELLSFDTAIRYGWENFLIVVSILSGVFVIILFMFVMTLRIGRHPERYGKLVKRFFFKNGYLN